MQQVLQYQQEELSSEIYTLGRRSFLNTNFYNKIIEITDEEDLYSDFRGIKDLFEEIPTSSNFNFNDYKYLSKSIKKAIIKSLDDSKMTKEYDEFDVLGEEVKGIRYTYTIDAKTAKKMSKTISDTFQN